MFITPSRTALPICSRSSSVMLKIFCSARLSAPIPPILQAIGSASVSRYWVPADNEIRVDTESDRMVRVGVGVRTGEASVKSSQTLSQKKTEKGVREKKMLGILVPKYAHSMQQGAHEHSTHMASTAVRSKSAQHRTATCTAQNSDVHSTPGTAHTAYTAHTAQHIQHTQRTAHTAYRAPRTAHSAQHTQHTHTAHRTPHSTHSTAHMVVLGGVLLGADDSGPGGWGLGNVRQIGNTAQGIAQVF